MGEAKTAVAEARTNEAARKERRETILLICYSKRREETETRGVR